MKAVWYNFNVHMTFWRIVDSMWLSSICERLSKLLRSFGKFVAFTFAILVFQNGGLSCFADEIDLLESRGQSVCEDCDLSNSDIFDESKAGFEELSREPEDIKSDVVNTGLDEVGTQSTSESTESTTRVNPEELYQKGRAHEAGDGVIKNASLAWSYYHQAGDQDHVLSQYRLAEMSFHGIGVPVNYARAAEWYERAAMAGNIEAQWMLGKMFTRGTGLPRDSFKGSYWLERAREGGLGTVSGEEEAVLVPASTSNGDAAVSMLLGEPRLDVEIGDSLSAFGDEVGSTLNELLANLYFNLSEDKGLELRFLTDGKVRVWEQDEEVVISWPSLTYVVRKIGTTNTVSTLYIETPAMDYLVRKEYSPLSRQDGDQTLLSMKLPAGSLISVRDDGGVAMFEASASGGVITVGWSKSLKIVTETEIDWRDAKIDVPVLGLQVGASAVGSKMEVLEARDGLFRAPSSLQVNDLAIQRASVLSDSISVSSLLLGFDVEGSIEQIRAAIMQTGDASRDGSSEIDLLRDDETLSKLLSTIMRSFSGRLEILDIAAFDIDKKMIGSLDLGRLSLGFDGLDSNSALFDFRVGYDGLNYAGNPSFTDLVPQSVNIDLGLVSVPMRGLWEEMVSVARTNAEKIETSEGITIEQELVLGLLRGSEAHLRIRDISVGSESFSVQAVGELFPNHDGVRPVLGKFNVVTKGIEELLAHPLVALMALGYQGQIEQILSMSRQDGPVGTDRLKFDFDFSSNGAVLLNDQDLLAALSKVVPPTSD